MQSTAVEMYHFIQSQLNKAEQEKYEAGLALKRADECIALFQPWAETLKLAICPGCNGHGYVRHFIAQDEVKAVACTACNKTGIKTVVT